MKIIAVGPGKWRKGEWWSIRRLAVPADNTTEKYVFEWEWQDGWFEPTVVKPGQTGILGPYTDLEIGEQILCMQNDIRCLVD